MGTPTPEPKHNVALRDAAHQRWMKKRNRRQEGDNYDDRWWAEQCGHCQFWIPLSAPWGVDYGGCANGASDFDGLIRFEHDGCQKFAAAEEWGLPGELSELARENQAGGAA